MAAALGLVIAVTPIAVAIGASTIFAHIVARPTTPAALAGWWIGLLGGSTALLFAVERAMRRLVPLTTLMRMTIVFPDHAPSRFRAAMRASTARSLEKMVERASGKGRPDEKVTAAEHILELLALLGTHDRRTRGHSDRVRAYTRLIADQLPMAPEDRFKLEWAGMLHDVGKLQVPAEILNKTSKPTPAEWRVIKSHPAAANALLAPLRTWLGPWIHGADQHHEKFDGSGYPLGLKGSDITLAGRVVAVADAFEVMTAARSYKKPIPIAEAREELLRCANTHFDPAVLRAFVEVSLGDLRKVMGPMAILAQLPLLGGLRDIGQLLGQVGPRATQLAAGGATAVAAAAAAVSSGGVAVAGPVAPAASRPPAVEATSIARDGHVVIISRPGLPFGATTTAKVAVTAASTPASPPSVVVTAAGPPPTDAATTAAPRATSSVATTVKATNTTAKPKGDTSTTAKATTTTKATAPPVTTTTTAAGGHAPVAKADTMSGMKGTTIPMPVLLNDSDPDGDLNPLSVTIVSGPTGSGTIGSLSVTPVLGFDVVMYTAPASSTGAVTFRYQVCDKARHCATAEATVTVR